MVETRQHLGTIKEDEQDSNGGTEATCSVKNSPDNSHEESKHAISRSTVPKNIGLSPKGNNLHEDNS